VLDPGPRDYAHGIEYSRIRDGHVTYLISIVTTRIQVGLVGTEGNYPSSTRVLLLNPEYIRAGRDLLLSITNLNQYKPP
jgi:hypothetical protein